MTGEQLAAILNAPPELFEFEEEDGEEGRRDLYAEMTTWEESDTDSDLQMSMLILNDAFTSTVAMEMELGDTGGWYVKPRSTLWVTRFLLEVFDDKEWHENMRMTRATFMELCNILGPTIKRKDTNYRLAIPSKVRVAAALYKLTRGVDFVVVSQMFGLGKSTCYKVLREVVSAVNTIMLPHYLKWPEGPEMITIMRGFEVRGFLNCQGAIDCSKLKIEKPHGVWAPDFFSYKNGYCIQMQAVCDPEYRFIDVCVGHPGSLNDSRVLRLSQLCALICSQNRLHECLMNVGGTPLRPYLLGDSGFPQLPWLMTPFSRLTQDITYAQRIYNRRLSGARVLVENSFGVLKETFQELGRRSKLDVQFLSRAAMACCVLHNMLLSKDQIQVAEIVARLEEERRRANTNANDEDAQDLDNLPAHFEEDGEVCRRTVVQQMIFGPDLVGE